MLNIGSMIVTPPSPNCHRSLRRCSQ